MESPATFFACGDGRGKSVDIPLHTRCFHLLEKLQCLFRLPALLASCHCGTVRSSKSARQIRPREVINWPVCELVGFYTRSLHLTQKFERLLPFPAFRAGRNGNRVAPGVSCEFRSAQHVKHLQRLIPLPIFHKHAHNRIIRHDVWLATIGCHFFQHRQCCLPLSTVTQRRNFHVVI